MKPKNFPLRKLKRQLKAGYITLEEFEKRKDETRNIRTKKNRAQ